MTVETEVANLTTAVDNLAEAVNVKKATLDASVADAESARDAAAASATTASGHATSAAASAAAAASTASGIAGFDLDAIAASKAVTAVDVFVYDTSKDSDGGAWRKRTQHTSWYNETLNTATRGSRREFPAVAVIVAEAAKVTIYDGDDPSLPMWMVFNPTGSASVAFSATASLTNTGVFAKNGLVVKSANTYGIAVADFLNDTADRYWNAGSRRLHNGPISDRNNDVGFTASTAFGLLVNSNANDVAMTVLPDAPIDPATGLPVPTIFVGTDGGWSQINSDGTVYDFSFSSNPKVTEIAYDESRGLVCWNGDSNAFTFDRGYFEHPLLTADISGVSYTAHDGSSIFHNSNNPGVTWPTFFSATPDGTTHSIPSAVGNSQSLYLLSDIFEKRLSAITSSGAIAAVTSSYNTGWMNGDIKGAFLADTDDTDLVGVSVVSEDFASGLGGFTAVNEYAVISNVSGRLRVASNDASQYGRALRSFTTVVGNTYVVEMENFAGGGSAVFYVGSSAGGAQYGFYSGTGVKRVTFKATTTTSYITCYNDGVPSTNYAEYDNLTVKLADADRSVNNNGLIVNGTVTRSPVATGAELVAYSGFSASNYFEQPYNADLDFGTGDFCVMGWVKPSTSGDEYVFDCRDASASTGFGCYRNNSTGKFTFITQGGGGGSFLVGTSSNLTSVWTHLTLSRRDGVLEMYVNGVLEASSSPLLRNVDSTSRYLVVGNSYGYFSYHAWQGSLALLRISATAPTAEQIKKIYEDEKVLFQENAAATLYGASDAVTALAHDSDTGLLHVGTSAGRSVFQGLRRVSNTTTAVGTAISASNGLVVEE